VTRGAGQITADLQTKNHGRTRPARARKLPQRFSKRPARRAPDDAGSVLDAKCEESFLWGCGADGPCSALHTLDDWQRLWGEWREIVLPKAIEYFPGRRPLACYVVGEIPPRPLQGTPPLSHRWLRLYVAAANGTGQWHYDYPTPWQECEAAYLWRIGVIDADELRRARKAKYAQARRDYPWEQGAFL
jgi:hypothetical protein